MIELCHHDHNYLAICQHYRAIYDTPQVQADEDRWKAVKFIMDHSIFEGDFLLLHVGIEECCAVCSVGSL